MNKLQSMQRNSEIYTYVINKKRENYQSNPITAIVQSWKRILTHAFASLNPSPPHPFEKLMCVCVFCPQAGPSL